MTDRNYKWYVVGMLWWIAFFNYADRQAIFSVFPLLSKEYHLSNLQLGLLGSSFAWVYGLSAPFVPAISSIACGASRRSSGGLQIWSTVCMATVLARNFGQLLFFRAAEGLGETFYFPASMSLISDYHGKADAVARHGDSPDQRLHRHDRGRILRGTDRPELRLAMFVCDFRRAAESCWASCCIAF